MPEEETLFSSHVGGPRPDVGTHPLEKLISCPISPQSPTPRHIRNLDLIRQCWQKGQQTFKATFFRADSRLPSVNWLNPRLYTLREIVTEVLGLEPKDLKAIVKYLADLRVTLGVGQPVDSVPGQTKYQFTGTELAQLLIAYYAKRAMGITSNCPPRNE